MEQQIHFCTASDGVSIAYATVGSGPPLVYVCGWPGHLAMEWEQPFVREFLEAFGQRFTLVRYDMRGSGLSAGGDPEISLEALVRDLEAVVGDLGHDQVALLSLGLLAGPVAIAYGVAHPDRVSHLVLLSACMRGDDLATKEQQKAMIDFLAAFGQVATPDFMDPKAHGLDPELIRQAGAIHRSSASREVTVALMRTFFSFDLTDIAGRIACSVLTLHGNRDVRVPLALSRELASRIKDVKFVPYQGAGSAPWADRDVLLPEIFRFLGVEPPVLAPRPQAHDDHAGAVHTVLFTDIEDSTGLTQRLGDAKAQELVREHNTVVREALRAHNGTEVKHTGDGIMASFHSASGALECAVAIQRAVHERDGSDLRVRIGLNAGEPVEEESDLFGTAVQLARRVCDQADGGGILASDVVRQLAAGKSFLFADRGEVALRGFEDPVRLFEVRWNAGSS